LPGQHDRLSRHFFQFDREMIMGWWYGTLMKVPHGTDLEILSADSLNVN